MALGLEIQGSEKAGAVTEVAKEGWAQERRDEKLILDFSVLAMGQLTSLAIGKVVHNVLTWLCLPAAKSRDCAALCLPSASPSRKQAQLGQRKRWPTRRGMTPALFLTGTAQISPRLPQVHPGGGAAAGGTHLQGQI